MDDKVSVLIPVYNTDLFVEESVRSIMNQTYKNLEIIIVDDCSTDNTYGILRSLALEDSRIRLFRNATNKKIAETLNFAFSVSTGDYIARMDGDDISSLNRIDLLISFLKKNKQFGLVACQVMTIDEDGNELGKSVSPISEADVYKTLDCRMSPLPHIWVARRTTYEKIGLYRLPPAEDYDFLLRAKTLGIRFKNINEYLYKVRIRRGNTATAQGLKQRLASELVYMLYNERKKYGYEKTVEPKFNKFLETSDITLYFFSKSNEFLMKAVKGKNNKFKLLLNTVLAVFFSPYYQIKFLYRRWKYKKIAKRSC